MSLPTKTTRMRLMAIVLCLLAFSVYFTFAPTITSATSCGCGTCGVCTGHAECVCLYNGTTCTGGQTVQNSCNCGGCDLEFQ